MAAQEVVVQAQVAARDEVLLVVLDDLVEKRQVARSRPAPARRVRLEPAPCHDSTIARCCSRKPRMTSKYSAITSARGSCSDSAGFRRRRFGCGDVEGGGDGSGAPRWRQRLGRGGGGRIGIDTRPLLQGLAVARRIAQHRQGVVEAARRRDGNRPPGSDRPRRCAGRRTDDSSAHRPTARVELRQHRQQLLDAVATAQVAGDRGLRLAGGNVVDECASGCPTGRPRRSSRRRRPPSARWSRESARSATTAPRRACARPRPSSGKAGSRRTSRAARAARAA